MREWLKSNTLVSISDLYPTKTREVYYLPPELAMTAFQFTLFSLQSTNWRRVFTPHHWLISVGLVENVILFSSGGCYRAFRLPSHTNNGFLTCNCGVISEEMGMISMGSFEFPYRSFPEIGLRGSW